MKKIKVLNLYAGIGGNRKLWENVEVTAVEYDESIADVYRAHFPQDIIVVGDAHQYLLDHHNDGWDFIWSSTPCPTHSRARFWSAMGPGVVRPVYPDMRLYQEILFLKHYCKKSKWNVENVIPYYNPLIPSQKLGRHLFWSNFIIKPMDKTKKDTDMIHSGAMKPLEDATGFSLAGCKLNQRKDKILRNCVLPEIGKHIFDCAMGYRIKEEQGLLFA